MNIERFKYLAGMSAATSKEVDPTVSKRVDRIKIREEVDFRLLAKKYGATVSVAEGTGTLTIKEDTLENSQKKMNELLAEWLSFKNGTPVQPVQEETVIESELASEETSEEVAEVIEVTEEVAAEAEVVEVTEEVAEVAVETPKEDQVQEGGNNNFMQPVDDSKNELNDRMGTNQERSVKISVPAEVKKAVSGRIAELKAAMAEYDEKGYNDHSQKEKAIECLEQIMKDLSSGDREGLKQAQIFFSTLMSPITDLFPASLPVYLANAENVAESWTQQLEEITNYRHNRSLLRDAESRRDMRDEINAVGVEDDSMDMSHDMSDSSSDDDEWMGSAGSCYDYDVEPPEFYAHTVQCPVCGEDNKISPAHLQYMQNPMCLDCETVHASRIGFD